MAKKSAGPTLMVQHVSPGEGYEVCAAYEAADENGAYDFADTAAGSVQGDGEAAPVGELA